MKKELDGAIKDTDFELALEVINDLIKMEHDNEQFWNSRGVILSKLDMIDESLQAFDQALELNPGESRIWYSKGCVLMDSGNPRAGLACFYKSLDCEPGFEKARERFIRCLNDLVLLQRSETQEDSEDLVHEAPTKVVGETDEVEEPPEVEEPKARKMRGTYLDDEMFSSGFDEDEDEDMEEEWDDDDEDEDEEDMEEEEWDDDEDEDEEDEEDEDDEDEEDDDDEDEEDDEVEMASITCRCGENIWITSEKRPYRFECKKCGRTGTLK